MLPCFPTGWPPTVDELVNALVRQLASVTGALHAAKRQARIRSRHRIDEGATGLQLVDAATALL